VNWAHLRTFVWVRWRLAVNQLTRSGAGGAAFATILTVLMVAGGALMLLIGFLVGFFVLRGTSPRAVMVVWDGAIVGFVVFWMIGLMSELQRSDTLSLDRFLHLPVSPTGAFLINYFGSSVSLSLVLMLPAMTGLSAGLVLSRGPGMLLLFPLVAAFFLMMTAVAYQFRGWLASLMANPRRRRTILTVVPALFVLAFQLPNLWNNLSPGARERREARTEARRVTRTLDDDLAAGRITREEYLRRRPVPPDRNSDADYESARLVNMIAPPGWLAYGAEAAAEGRVWPALAGVFGMTLIGALSLRRAYGTTLRLYRGDFDTRRRPTQSAIPVVSSGPATPARRSAAFVETRLPWISERVSGVAVTGLRSWMRAPEMKMTLLTPVIMLIVFSRMFAAQSASAPELLRPLTASGLAAFILIIGLVGPAGNQFGYDRAGFRAFVLSPVPRRDVLIGKNLSLLPFALVMMAVVVGLSHWFNPMRFDHLAAVLLQLIPMYLVFCLAANLLSIIGPLALKPGSGMPARHQGIRSLFPLVFMLVVSVALGITLIPLGIEAIFSAFNWFTGFPVYLAFGVVQVILTVWVYRLMLDWQGDLLQRRERHILEIVSSRAE
jgi:ABC-2 type transport system permease protein